MNNMALLQIQIYTKKFMRTLKKESIISIFIGIIITLLVMGVTQKNMFENYEGTKSGLFSIICVCIWIGIFNSIQLVCREKNDIVKDELDKSLHASSYMAAHFIYQFILCAIQSIIVFAIFYMFMDGKGDIGSPIYYFITIFFIVFASDAMAFVISSAVPNPVVAMTIMPLLLLIQLVMAGVLFELGDIASIAANFTVSKWGMEAFGKIGDISNIPSKMDGQFSEMEKLYNMKIEPENGWVPEADVDKFSGGITEIIACWSVFLLFIIAFYFISVFALKMTTRKIKK